MCGGGNNPLKTGRAHLPMTMQSKIRASFVFFAHWLMAGLTLKLPLIQPAHLCRASQACHPVGGEGASAYESAVDSETSPAAL